ncbi:bifunctional nicotinamide-nucleotide adenylyltransferase/Nudix hydroxylase [bacterium]|nr:bifunctional nicotinamide-nucleotide adenylyltransferase/Nudix hydroxylase [bacterium]
MDKTLKHGLSPNSRKYSKTVFIGRFQPFQLAHLKTVEEALEISDQVIIAIGSAKRPRTIKNPWTVEERQVLIEKSLEEHFSMEKGWTDYPHEIKARIKFIYIRDHMYNNTRWATEIYSKAVSAGATQCDKTCLIGCFKDDSSWYLKMFPQWSFHEVKPIYHKSRMINATDIRTEIFEKECIKEFLPLISKDVYESIEGWVKTSIAKDLKEEYTFLKNYKKQWESAPYAPTFVTADSVVIKSGHILLIKRKFNPGKGLWALPGGFLNPQETVEKCALRELKEETGLKVSKKILEANIKEVSKFDHPQRSLRGRTITFAHLINLDEGPLPEIKAGDDASGAHWIPLADLASLEEQTFEDHMDIIQRLVSKY